MTLTCLTHRLRAHCPHEDAFLSICGLSAWLSSSWVASWFRLLLRQAAGMPPDRGRTRAPRASPILTASAESSGQNSDMHCAMILTVSRSWRAVSLLSSAASAGSTGSSKHQSCSGISAVITRSLPKAECARFCPSRIPLHPCNVGSLSSES